MSAPTIPRDVVEYVVSPYLPLPSLRSLATEYPYLEETLAERYRSRVGNTIDYLTAIGDNDTDLMEFLLDRDEGLADGVLSNLRYFVEVIFWNGSLDIVKVWLDSPWIDDAIKQRVVDEMVSGGRAVWFLSAVVGDWDLADLVIEYLDLGALIGRVPLPLLDRVHRML